MWEQFIFWSVFILSTVAIITAFALPPTLREKSWKRFFIAAILSTAGIIVPLLTFVFSMFLIPEWKGGCRHEWLDCFHVGKWALAPLVLWACAAFYAIQILRTKHPQRTWIVLGIFSGAVVSIICFIIGMFIHLTKEWNFFLFIPCYVAVWYSILCIKSTRRSNTGILPYIITLAGSIPLWAACVYLSKKQYLALPDNPPDCFVVTAALRGHQTVVGPLVSVNRYNEERTANHQLITFWNFESLWQKRSPRTQRMRRLFELRQIAIALYAYLKKRYS